MSTTRFSRWTLVVIAMLVAASLAACSARPAASTGAPGDSHTATPTVSASPLAAEPGGTPVATGSSAPPASAWLSASEIPFGATYNWTLFTGNGNSEPIGLAAGNGAYFVSPATVFQAITTCGSPSLILSSPLGAWQRQFRPTSGDQLDMAGQWISSYPDPTTAEAAWRGLQAAYAGCLAQLDNPQITLTETVQTQDAMAWFLSTNGATIGSLPPYSHEYFVLHDKQIAYLYVDGGGPALASTPDDAHVVATIAQHLGT